MPNDDEEALVVLKCDAYLKRLCAGRWHNLEWEDRLSELKLMLVQVLRRFPTDSGHFLADFECIAVPYMDELNRGEPSRYFPRCLSLEAPRRSDACEGPYCLLDVLPDRREPDISVELSCYLEQMPPEDSTLVRALLEGNALSAVARKHGLTPARAKRRVRALMHDYYQAH